MKQLAWTVGLIAVTIAVSALALRVVHQRHLLHASAQSPPARSSQTSRIPAQQPPPRTAGVMIVGAGSNLTVIRPASAEPDDYSYLHISFTGNGEMLFKNAESRLVGFDTKSGKLFNEIANSSYDEGDQIDDDDEEPAQSAPAPVPTPEPKSPSGLTDNGFRRIEIGHPAPGTYLLTVMTDPRSGNSKYSLEISFTSRGDKMTFTSFTDVAAPAGAVHTYKLLIPPDPLGEIKAELISPADQHSSQGTSR